MTARPNAAAARKPPRFHQTTRMASWPPRESRGRTSTAQKRLRGPDAMRQRSAAAEKLGGFIRATGPPFFSFFYDGGAPMACERHAPPRAGATLMRKRQTSCGRSVEIGAPVFITLVYRLNSHPPTPHPPCLPPSPQC